MAATSMLTSNTLARKNWESSVKGFVDIYRASWVGHMFQRGTIVEAAELTGKKAGDETTFSFAGILTGTGIGEGGTLDGNEESLDLQSFTMKTGVFRHAVLNPNDEDTIEGQRSNVNFAKTAEKLLPEFHRARMDASAFNQLAGITATTITVDSTAYTGDARTFVQGLNSVTAPTSQRIVRAGGAASDQALTSSDTMSLDYVDDALVLTEGYPTMVGFGSDNDEYDLYLSLKQIRDLKRENSGNIQWYQNQLALINGGKDAELLSVGYNSKKPVARYANVNIYSANRVALGQNGSTDAAISTVRRGVLVGKNALAYGCPFGTLSGDGAVPLRMKTQMKDYDYYKGIEARALYGLKKIVFDSQDYGSIVISTYAG